MATEREGRKRTRSEAAALVIADCSKCGQPFGQESSWMTTCMPCYKEAKSYDLYGSDVGYVALQAEVVRLREKVRAAEEKARAAAKASASSAAPAAGADELSEERLTQILLLCHPDRHSNSTASNEVTRWLISLRKKRKNPKGP